MLNKHHVVFFFMFFVFLFSPTVYSADENLSPEIIARNIFLGQIYPSGNLYLKAFSTVGETTQPLWPERVLIRGLDSRECIGTQFLFGNFKRTIKQEIKGDVSYSEYFPGTEGMDDGHNNCGEAGGYTKNNSYVYLNSDFFYSAFDYCDPNDGIAQYVSPYRQNQSFRIIGLGTKISISNIKILNGQEKRPLTSGEKIEVEKQKQQYHLSESKGECTTVAKFLDDATELLTFEIKDSPYKILLSNYSDPGCDGHLSTIYVLDIYDQEKLLKRFELFQYQGPI